MYASKTGKKTIRIPVKFYLSKCPASWTLYFSSSISIWRPYDCKREIWLISIYAIMTYFKHNILHPAKDFYIRIKFQLEAIFSRS